MKVDLSCPIELRSYELIADDAGNTRANIRLYNLDKRRISAFDAVAQWEDEATGRAAAAPFFADRLRAEPHGYFGITLSTSAFDHPDHVELNISRVCFEDGSREWRSGSGTVVDIAERSPLSGQEQNVLFAAAGADAVRFAAEDRELWHCVCGRDNLRGQSHCVRCGRSHGEVFPGLLREALMRGDARGEVDLPLDDLSLEERRARSAALQAQGAAVQKRVGLLTPTLAGLTALAFFAALLILNH